MGRLRRSRYALAATVLAILVIGGCGGHKPAGTSPFPVRVSLTPSTVTSLQLGSTITFTASAQNGTNNNISATFTYVSSDTTILNVSPAGVACAGHWDISYGVCTPGNVGVVYVTASADGVGSKPTIIFVHQPIDQVVVSGILPLNQYVQEPCLSQGQTMTVQAQALSQGTDITTTVGPFTWSANNSTVATIAPIITNFTYNVPTNQATVTAAIPGITQIYATASGVTSTSFQQPQYTNASGTLSPLLDFFETCPIQNIMLEVGSGSQLTGQTSFVANKGTSETITAVVTDVMGNTSLVGSDTPVILSKIPLTWTSSQPTVVGLPTGCLLSCALSTPTPGAASITASCSPPTCNIGYPYVPPSLATPSALATCASFFGNCTQFIPLPVYSSPFCTNALTGAPCPNPPTPGSAPVPPAISGLVTGATGAASVLATSTGCAAVNPIDCATSLYNVSTSKAVAGNQNPLPSSPTSLMFDLAGDKAYMGSEIQAVTISPASLGSSTGAFGSVGTVTGKIIGISHNGSIAVFSDTTLNPNQVFVVNTTTSSSPTVTAYPIASATVAGFSPDGLKAYIYGLSENGSPNLYVYSTLQALQTIPLATGTTVNSVAFSSNGAFAYIVQPSLAGGGPAVSVLNVCNNSVAADSVTGATSIPLSATPISFKALPDGIHFIALESGGAFDYITATVTPIRAATIATPATSLCPMSASHTVRSLNLGEGTITPLDFFTSPDGSLMYVVAEARADVLVYDFATGSTTGIPLTNNALPVQVGMSADAGTIVVAGSDGYMHVVTTSLGGSDVLDVPFPNLPNYYNPYCTFTPTEGPCSFNLMAVRP